MTKLCRQLSLLFEKLLGEAVSARIGLFSHYCHPEGAQTASYTLGRDLTRLLTARIYKINGLDDSLLSRGAARLSKEPAFNPCKEGTEQLDFLDGDIELQEWIKKKLYADLSFSDPVGSHSALFDLIHLSKA